MGLFSSKTKTYVDSVVYNLKGDQDPYWFAPNTAISAIRSNVDSVAQSITDGLIAGSGSRIKKFFRWMISSGYADEVGLATSTYWDISTLTNQEASDLLKQNISLGENQDIEVTSVYIGEYEYYRIADQWVYLNKPEAIGTNYTVEEVSEKGAFKEWGENEDEDGHIRYYPIYYRNYYIEITFIDGTKQRIPEEVDGTIYINKDNRYLYIIYSINTVVDPVPPETLPTITKKPQYLVYGYKTGNPSYDAVFKNPVGYELSYAPYIPLRLWNEFITMENNPILYKFCKKATHKITGNDDYQDLIDAVADNKSIGDIDFTYIHFGVALNCPYNVGRKYIFNFFQNMYEYYGDGSLDALDPEDKNNPLPTLPNYTDRVINGRQVWIKSDNQKHNINFDIGIEWGSINKGTENGLGKPDAKEGDYWLTTYDVRNSYKDDDGDKHYYTTEYTKIWHQISSNRYEYILLSNLAYGNKIYGGKSVIYSTKDALNTPEGEDCGFILPLQVNNFKELPLVEATDLTQFCNYLIFNCYKQVKQKWYQSGIFGIIITIVVVVVAVVFQQWYATGSLASVGTASAAAAAGSLSSVATGIGLSMGLTGMAASIVGAAVLGTALAIVSQVVMGVSQGIFGEKLGSIIGTIVMVVGSIYFSGFTLSSTGSLQYSAPAIWGSMMSASNIISTTFTGIGVYGDYLSACAKDMYGKTQELMDTYEDKMAEIDKMYKELYGSSLINPVLFNSYYQFIPLESWDTFRNRTLQTGSDIVDTSLNMIYNFTDLTLNTELQ